MSTNVKKLPSLLEEFDFSDFDDSDYENDSGQGAKIDISQLLGDVLHCVIDDGKNVKDVPVAVVSPNNFVKDGVVDLDAFYDRYGFDSSDESGSCEEFQRHAKDDFHADYEYDYYDDEKCIVRVLPARETHAVPTIVGLDGGGRKKKRNGAKSVPPSASRPRRVRKKKVRRVKEAYKPLVANEIKKEFEYVDSTMQRFNAAAAYYVWSMRLNDIYDPDPLILTGGITGFNEAAALYSRFHVKKVHIHAEFSGWETYPEMVGFVVSGSSFVGTVGNRAQAINALERYGTKIEQISEKGGMDRHTIDLWINPGKVLGNMDLYKGSGAYDGFYNGSPGSFVYINFIIVAPTAALLLPNGVIYSSSFKYYTQWYLGQSSLFSFFQFGRILEQRQELYHKLGVDGDNTSVIKALEDIDKDIRDSMLTTHIDMTEVKHYYHDLLLACKMRLDEFRSAHSKASKKDHSLKL